MLTPHRIPKIEDYVPLIGKEAVERISEKARDLRGLHLTNINSTMYGGGVAEILSSLTLLLNTLGLRAGWRAIQGTPDFFSITKKMHNALQGGRIRLTDLKKRIYEGVVRENAVRNHLDHDVVIIHDPQPLPMICHYKKKGPWIWRAHIDLSSPDRGLLRYLSRFINLYDAAILTLEDYRLPAKIPQVFFLPAIDPFTIKNAALSERETRERLRHYGVPTDLPLVVQISRFDRWKDPEGTIKAFRLASRQAKARLVILGNMATDDPEGEAVYHSLLSERDDRVLIMTRPDSALVNALQSRAAVVVQKSLREGFGLTVTEAMWKGTPVIGGNVGGIRVQIKNGVNGFLVSSVEEAAERLVSLLESEEMRREMGKKARESVRKNFLMSRLAEDYLDLFGSFETVFRLRSGREARRSCPGSGEEGGSPRFGPTRAAGGHGGGRSKKKSTISSGRS